MLIPAASVLALAAFAATPAAAIDCEGNFQVQKNGNRIATPFCQDGYLAIVAREYGMKVSAQGIRYNPSIKERACRFVGDDNRVRDTCTGYRNDDGNRIWR
jgi:dienelactone hydrolase